MSDDILKVSNRVRSDQRHLDEAIDWLYRSQDVTGCGGSAATYNLILGWQGPYPETTGYLASTLFEHARRYNCGESHTRALEMCEWLLTLQREEGGFPEGTDPTPKAAQNVFNTGQIVLGLSDAFEESGRRIFRDSVNRACAWLTSVQDRAGYWAKYDYKNQIHSYSSRVGWSLLRGWEVTGEDKYRAAARSNFEWATTQQRPSGWFHGASFEADERPFLHTIAYTIRGLLEGSTYWEDSLGFEAAKTAADALLDRQRQHSVLSGAYDENWAGVGYHCLTGNAQIAIIWLRLFELSGETRYREAARREIEFLKSTQRLSGPTEIRGGIKGSHPIWGQYMYLRYPNWAAKFFVDAIMTAGSLEE